MKVSGSHAVAVLPGGLAARPAFRHLLARCSPEIDEKLDLRIGGQPEGQAPVGAELAPHHTSLEDER
jgi:hypothetical protein